MGWKLNYMSNIMLRTLQNNVAMLVSSNPQPQVRLHVSTVIPFWTELHVMVMLACFAGQGQCCGRRFPASGMFACFHRNPLLDWKIQITCYVGALCRIMPRSAVSTLRYVCVPVCPPNSLLDWKTQCYVGVLCRTMSQSAVSSLRCAPTHSLWTGTLNVISCFFCTSESCRDGHYATSGVCLYRPLTRGIGILITRPMVVLFPESLRDGADG